MSAWGWDKTWTVFKIEREGGESMMGLRITPERGGKNKSTSDFVNLSPPQQTAAAFSGKPCQTVGWLTWKTCVSAPSRRENKSEWAERDNENTSCAASEWTISSDVRKLPGTERHGAGCERRRFYEFQFFFCLILASLGISFGSVDMLPFVSMEKPLASQMKCSREIEVISIPTFVLPDKPTGERKGTKWDSVTHGAESDGDTVLGKQWGGLFVCVCVCVFKKHFFHTVRSNSRKIIKVVKV